MLAHIAIRSVSAVTVHIFAQHIIILIIDQIYWDRHFIYLSTLATYTRFVIIQICIDADICNPFTNEISIASVKNYAFKILFPVEHNSPNSWF